MSKIKKVKIKEIALSDWKGLNANISFDGKTSIILGQNGIGKTSIYMSFCWLLTGYTDALNPSNHELFDSRKKMSESTPAAVVTAIIDVEGEEITLYRSAQPQYASNKLDGTYTKLSSDKYTFRVNDVEMSAKEYNDYIGRTIGDVSFLIYAINGERLANMCIKDKNGARKLLMSMSDINVSDVVSGYSELSDESCGDMNEVDILSDKYKELAKECEEAVNDLNVLIEDKKAELSSVEIESPVVIEDKIDDKIDELLLFDEKNTDYEVKRFKERCTTADLQSQISLLGIKKRIYREIYDKKKEQDVEMLKSKIKSVEQRNVIISKHNEIIKAINGEKWNKVLSLQQDVNELGKKVLELKRQSADLKNSFLDKNARDCPRCGKPFDEAHVSAMSSRFEEDKNDKIAELDKQIDDAERAITDKYNEMAKYQQEILDARYEEETPVGDMYAELKEVMARPDYSNTEECKEIENEIIELDIQIPCPFSDSEIKEIDREPVLNEYAELNKKLALSIHYEKELKKLEELSAKLRQKSNEWAENKRKMEALKRCKEEILSMVAEQINTHLNECKVVTYSKKKNGELKPDCQIETLDGVLYTTANNSLRTRICIDIQKMFCEKIGAEMPIFIDEANKFSSGNIPKYDGQMILIKASDDDQLTIKTMEEW